MAMYDTENLLMDLKAYILANYNNKIDEIEAEKNADDNAISLPTSLNKLGYGAGATPDNAVNAIGYLGQNPKNYIYDPYITLELLKHNKVEGYSELELEILVHISLRDPNDRTGEIRMLRYLRAFDEIFETGRSFGIVSISGVRRMPYLSQPDFIDTKTRRLDWGLSLQLTF